MLYPSIAIMLALLILGVPIYLGVFVGVLLLVLYEMNVDPVIISAVMFNKINLWPLLAVPLFLLAGYFVAYGGTARAMLGILNSFMRHIPGGPAYVIIIGCVIFAAMSSSSMAAVAGFAPIMLPMMSEMGYDRRFAIGLLVVSSTLGPIIPPSIMLIMYGVIAEQSIRDLYFAAFIPGFMIALLLFITVFIWARRGSYKGQPAASWGERWTNIKRGWLVLLMPPAILVPIYAGWVTPTEAAGVCVAYSFFLGAVVYRDLRLPQIWQSLKTTLRICSMVFIIIMSAFLLNLVLTYLRVPFNLSEMIADADLSAPVFLLVAIIAYLIMGMFFDPSAIMLVSVIILLPTVISLDIDPINYGILVTLVTGIAGITPPYGILLFTAVGVLREPFHVVARGCFVFYPAMIIGTFLVAYVPKIALFLPDIMD